MKLYTHLLVMAAIVMISFIAACAFGIDQIPATDFEPCVWPNC